MEFINFTKGHQKPPCLKNHLSEGRKSISLLRWHRESPPPNGGGRTTCQKTRPSTGRREREVRKEVEACRRGIMDEAVGRLTKHSTWAADGIAALARDSESDSVRLRAFRSIFLDSISVSKYNGLEGRVTEMEERISARDNNAAKKD